jgi:hypothetical protein
MQNFQNPQLVEFCMYLELVDGCDSANWGPTYIWEIYSPKLTLPLHINTRYLQHKIF